MDNRRDVSRVPSLRASSQRGEGVDRRPLDCLLPAASRLLLTATCLLILPGCGYMVGGAYQNEVRTVHVPIFTSDSFRRGLEFQLTEAVQKRIQTQTPFALADRRNADTVLTGHIVDVRKDVLSETAFDDPRELQMLMAIEVTWQDRRTGQILQQQDIPIPPDLVHLTATSEFAPEVGQSRATAEHDVMEKLARKIVNMMETPW